MRQKQLRGRKSKRQSKPEFTAKTRVFDLLKGEFHDELKQLTEDIRPYIRDGDHIDWKHLRFFSYDNEKTTKVEFILIIAQFLLRIGKGNGLKCRMSVFIRYLAESEHSNFALKYRSLNTLIYRMFGYLEGYSE